MDSLWVFILLLVALGTIVTVRLFLNGASEEADAVFEALATESQADARSPASRVAAAINAETTTADGRAATAFEVIAEAESLADARSATASSQPVQTPSPPAAWSGGDCPSCGSSTIPSAKFCGECGRRLVNG